MDFRTAAGRTSVNYETPLPVDARSCNTRSRVIIPSQAVGANKVFFDIFNSSSTPIHVTKMSVLKDGTVAVVGTLAVALFVTRTTAVGTGGTAATANATALNAPSISTLGGVGVTGVSARSAPTGGATGGAVLGKREIYTEETAASNYAPLDLIGEDFHIPAGTGIRVIQGSVASVGNLAFEATLVNE